WLVIVTSSAAWEKLWSPEPRIGFLAHARMLAEQLAAGAVPPDKLAQTHQLIFNDRLDAVLTALFLAITWVVTLDMLRVCWCALSGRRYPPSTESPHVPSRLVEDWVRD